MAMVLFKVEGMYPGQGKLYIYPLGFSLGFTRCRQSNIIGREYSPLVSVGSTFVYHRL